MFFTFFLWLYLLYITMPMYQRFLLFFSNMNIFIFILIFSYIIFHFQWDGCKNFITSRGPDKLVKNFTTLTDTWCGHFAASILWMQGLKLVEQPLIDSSGNILLWNGDVFSGSLVNVLIISYLSIKLLY